MASGFSGGQLALNTGMGPIPGIKRAAMLSLLNRSCSAIAETLGRARAAPAPASVPGPVRVAAAHPAPAPSSCGALPSPPRFNAAMSTRPRCSGAS